LLGAALFALEAWTRPASGPAGQGEIVVGEARVRNLAQNFHRTWQRAPTREELDGLVEAHVREEVMVREAIVLGLDRDDAIIRRRLQQKLEFIAEEAASTVRPSDDELAGFLAANAERYRVEPRLSLTQVFLDPQRRGAALDADARRLIERLNRDASAPPAEAGHRLALMEPRYVDVPRSELTRLFGSEFAARVAELPVGRWSGPIASGYGMHVVRLDAQLAGSAPSLADVRALVERDWASEQRRTQLKSHY
jgi:hypothetical protein